MHATSRDQIDEALNALAAALDAAEAATTDIGTRLSELVPLAATLADIVRTLVREWGEDAGGDLLYWSEATQRSITSWRRDAAQTPSPLGSLKQRLAAIEATARGWPKG